MFGKGKIEDFTWKGYLDFATCTECGRCQSQCPAWNTGKPLSPKLVIMDLRDHLFAKAPYIIGGEDGARGPTPSVDARARRAPRARRPASRGSRAPTAEQAVRPLVGDLASGGVIDPDVLWSCTTCGACVEQCPVDIEHIDHIVDMRRYQVLIESAFPSEAGVMLRNIENKGNPWGMADRGPRGVDGRTCASRCRRAEPGTKLDADIEYLFWVGCAGALEDRSQARSRSRSPSCCTPPASSSPCSARARRAPVIRPGASATSSCSRCWACRTSRRSNSIERAGTAEDRRDLPALLQHPRQRVPAARRPLRGRAPHPAARPGSSPTGRLTPVEPVDKSVTYHDPCYLGRHNKVYTPPREVLGAIPALTSQEMHRCKDRGFCCGAGGARFWMEEKIGKRINVERTDEAIGLDPDLISHRLPVLHGDAVRRRQRRSRPTARRRITSRCSTWRRSCSSPSVQAHLLSEARSRPQRMRPSSHQPACAVRTLCTAPERRRDLRRHQRTVTQ